MHSVLSHISQEPSRYLGLINEEQTHDIDRNQYFQKTRMQSIRFLQIKSRAFEKGEGLIEKERDL